jgi:sugar phosphate permease
LLLAAFSWPYAIANLPAGYLVDRFGPKKSYGIAATAWSLVSMATAAVNSFGFFYALRVALGVSESPFFTSGLKVGQRWFNKHERAVPVSVINTGSQIANAIAPPLLTFLMLTMSWRGMFVIIGALGIVVVAIWMKSYRDPTPTEAQLIKGDDADLTDTDAAPDRTKVSWGSLFTQPNTYFMIIGCFGIFYTAWVYLTWLPSYLQTSRGFSLTKTGWLAALPYLCGVLGVLVGGWLSTGLTRIGWRPVSARKAPIVAGAFLAALAVAPVPEIASDGLALVLLCIGYFAVQVPTGCIWTLPSDVVEGHQVSSLGSIQNFGGFLGAAVAPVITGVILQRTGGNYSMVFALGGVALLIGGLSYLIFVRDRRPAQPNRRRLSG